MVSDAGNHFAADDGWAMASHVALSGLMAVFPFIIFVAALAGVFGEQALTGQVAELLFRTWPEQVAGPIAGEVQQVLAQSSGRLLTLSAAISLWLASNGVEAARLALNRAYRVVDRRSIVWMRLQSLVFVLAGAALCLLLVLLGLVMTNAFHWITEHLPWLRPLQPVLALTGLAGTSILVVGGLVAAHLWLPSGRPPARELWPGIVLTLVLWLIAVVAITTYLATFANFARTYAGLAGVVTAIFFLYVVAAILIFGAEFNASLRRFRSERAGG